MQSNLLHSHGFDQGELMPEIQSLEAKKISLMKEFNETRLKVLDAARLFSGENVHKAFVGSWGILEILAHLKGWDLTNLDAARSILLGQVPDFYAYYDKDWASYNARLVAQWKQPDLEMMIKAVDESRAEMVEYLKQLSPDDLFGDHGVRRKRYKVTISRLIEADTKDVNEHLDQIRHFLKA
jgi:hypothetical protein